MWYGRHECHWGSKKPSEQREKRKTQFHFAVLRIWSIRKWQRQVRKVERYVLDCANVYLLHCNNSNTKSNGLKRQSEEESSTPATKTKKKEKILIQHTIPFSCCPSLLSDGPSQLPLIQCRRDCEFSRGNHLIKFEFSAGKTKTLFAAVAELARWTCSLLIHALRVRGACAVCDSSFAFFSWFN